MKKILLGLYLFAHLARPLSAQKWDAAWIIGNDATLEMTGGGTLLDFSTGDLSTSFVLKRLHSDAANTGMADKFGNLQFYSNGCVVHNAAHELMENGKIHRGGYTDVFCDSTLSYPASRVPQSILALPNFKDDSLYFLLSQRLEAPTLHDTTTVVGTVLYLNVIDMRENQGKGKVVTKQIEILSDTLNSENLQAIPHANGRDWWVIIPKFRSNCYYIVYLDAEGHTTVTKQCLGTTFGLDSWLGQAAFSPDGRHFARFHWKYNLNVFDFDRCSGVLSNAQTVTFPGLNFSRAGCAFSRSSRYLYTIAYTQVFQFDMQAPDLAASRTFIGEWDGFNTPYSTRFYLANLALDGKIYIGCPGQHQYIHVINEPELPGPACDFRQHAVELFTSNFWSFPNQAHYRLGPVEDSACDSLGLDNKPWAFFRWETGDSLFPLQRSFVDLSGYQPTNWHWNFDDGSGSEESHPTHLYDSTGTYTVCLTVSNAFGSDTLCRTLYLGTSTATEPGTQGYVTVAPNPFRDWLRIAPGPNLHSPVFRLYDQMGRLIRQERLNVNAVDLNTSGLAPGFYAWELMAGGTRIQTGKCIKLSD